MEYKHYKEFWPSVRALRQKGGSFQKAAEKVEAVIGRTSRPGAEPFEGMKLTNQGESRIKKCLKYDLTGRARLITIQDNDITLFCFVGDHDACDEWLNRHRGATLFENDKGQIDMLPRSTVDGSPDERPRGPPALRPGKLFEGLQPESYFDRLIEGIPRQIVRRLEQLESIHEESNIYDIAQKIEESDRALAIYDVFSLLRQDKTEEALDRAKLFLGEGRVIEELTEQEIKELAEGTKIKQLRSDDPRFRIVFEHFVKTASYMDWMLFLHPDQQKIVDAAFSGPTKLAGVSGSGKTCIVVQRAIHLAEKYIGEKILILTLNRQLARLIADMVDAACPEDLRKQIDVKPFFTLCQELLDKFEPENDKLYNDVTWKSKEHIDEIWREYYRCGNYSPLK